MQQPADRTQPAAALTGRAHLSSSRRCACCRGQGAAAPGCPPLCKDASRRAVSIGRRVGSNLAQRPPLTQQHACPLGSAVGQNTVSALLPNPTSSTARGPAVPPRPTCCTAGWAQSSPRPGVAAGRCKRCPRCRSRQTACAAAAAAGRCAPGARSPAAADVWGCSASMSPGRHAGAVLMHAVAPPSIVCTSLLA